MSGRSKVHSTTRAPRSGQCQRIALTAASGQSAALTQSVLGSGCVKIRCRPGAATAATQVQFFFSTSNITCTLDATGGGTAVGWSLMAGQSEDFELTNETIINWASDGKGFLDIVRSDQERAGTR